MRIESTHILGYGNEKDFMAVTSKKTARKNKLTA